MFGPASGLTSKNWQAAMVVKQCLKSLQRDAQRRLSDNGGRRGFNAHMMVRIGAQVLLWFYDALRW